MSSASQFSAVRKDACPVFSHACKFIRTEENNRKLAMPGKKFAQPGHQPKKKTELEEARLGKILKNIDSTPRFASEVKRSEAS